MCARETGVVTYTLRPKKKKSNSKCPDLSLELGFFLDGGSKPQS